MKLRRVRAGVYRTIDGRFTLMLDPLSGGECEGYGFRSWLVYEGDETEPMWLGGTIHQRTLLDARTLLEEELKGKKP